MVAVEVGAHRSPSDRAGATSTATVPYCPSVTPQIADQRLRDRRLGRRPPRQARHRRHVVGSRARTRPPGGRCDAAGCRRRRRAPRSEPLRPATGAPPRLRSSGRTIRHRDTWTSGATTPIPSAANCRPCRADRRPQRIERVRAVAAARRLGRGAWCWRIPALDAAFDGPPDAVHDVARIVGGALWVIGVAAMAVPAVVSLTATRVVVPLGGPGRRWRPPSPAPTLAVAVAFVAMPRWRRRSSLPAPSSGGPSCRRPRTATRTAILLRPPLAYLVASVAHMAGVGRRRARRTVAARRPAVGASAASRARSPSLGSRCGRGPLAQAVTTVVRARPDRRRRARPRRARRDADGAPQRARRAAPGAGRHRGARPHRARRRTRGRARHARADDGDPGRHAEDAARPGDPLHRRASSARPGLASCCAPPASAGCRSADGRSAGGDAAAEHAAGRRRRRTRRSARVRRAAAARPT